MKEREGQDDRRRELGEVVKGQREAVRPAPTPRAAVLKVELPRQMRFHPSNSTARRWTWQVRTCHCGAILGEDMTISARQGLDH